MDDMVLTKREAAAFIGVSERTLANLHNLMKGPPRLNLSDRRVGYRKSSLLAWLESREQSVGKKAA